jgi:hypothetical protein
MGCSGVLLQLVYWDLGVSGVAANCVLCGGGRQHFHKDVRKQLYHEGDDRNFFNRIKDGLKSVEAQLEEGRVAVQHLELFLLNVACDDPGTVIGSQLLLPLLQDRLDGAALAFKAERAKMAEDEIIAMEVRGWEGWVRGRGGRASWGGGWGVCV